MINRKLSVVVPCFNEEENIERTYKRLSGVLSGITKDYEIIFVENGSTDNSYNLLKAIVNKDPHIVVLSFSRNFGIYGAYASGLKYAKGDAVVCIDCDLQDPPELIEDMVKKWNEGFDVIYGVRSKRKGSFLRKFLVKLYYRLLKRLSYIEMSLDAGDFSLLDRKVVDAMNKLPEHLRYLKGLRSWVGFKQFGLEYEREKRQYGQTKFSLLDYFRLGLENIFSFSFKPLELISYLAIAVVFLTLMGIVVYFIYFLIYPSTPRGFMTLILVILFLGGIQLLCLSIIGHYLAIIFEESKNRPFYIVKEILQNKSK